MSFCTVLLRIKCRKLNVITRRDYNQHYRKCLLKQAIFDDFYGKVCIFEELAVPNSALLLKVLNISKPLITVSFLAE